MKLLVLFSNYFVPTENSDCSQYNKRRVHDNKNQCKRLIQFRTLMENVLRCFITNLLHVVVHRFPFLHSVCGKRVLTSKLYIQQYPTEAQCQMQPS